MNTSVKYENTKGLGVKRFIRDAALLCMGGVGYYGLEVLFRGHSHWTMALCGGVCLLFIYHMNKRMIKKKLPVRAFGGALIITAVELVCGCIVNLICKWRVWDYSHLPLNLLGQICLPFTLLWFGLCFPICFICGLFCKARRTQN